MEYVSFLQSTFCKYFPTKFPKKEILAIIDSFSMEKRLFTEM